MAFLLVVYSAKVLPVVTEQTSPNYFEEHYPDYQLLMGASRPPLSQYLSTLDTAQHIVLIYIPLIIIIIFILGPLIFCLRVPILASTSMLPSFIRYHTGRFFGALGKCASLHPLNFPVAVLILTSKSPKDILQTG